MSQVKAMSAVERIESLLDAGSFIEIGASVHARNTDFNMPEKQTPADGVITGYGTIDSNLVYVFSQDPSVMGGAIGEMHARKIEKIYELALKMGAPVIGMYDCAGLRLQEATDALDALGIQTADGGFRCNSAVCSCVWSVRRRYSFAGGIIRFYFYGEGHKRTFCECTEYTG